MQLCSLVPASKGNPSIDQSIDSSSISVSIINTDFSNRPLKFSYLSGYTLGGGGV